MKAIRHDFAIRVCGAALAFGLAAGIPMHAGAQSPAVDPAATRILKRMTDYMGSLKAFRARTQNTIEDLAAPGMRIDLEVAASVTIERPNKLLAERSGDLVRQSFYYDGKTLALYDPAQRVYATEPAPGTLVEVVDYARNVLGLIIPAADLIYPDAFGLLMQDVTSAAVIGKTVINGVRCDHLLFRRPGVDFQLCVADGKVPRPVKFIVTDTGTPELLSVSTVITELKPLADVPDAKFRFAPPKAAKPIAFMHRIP